MRGSSSILYDLLQKEKGKKVQKNRAINEKYETKIR
jgi:hypothetical protein